MATKAIAWIFHTRCRRRRQEALRARVRTTSPPDVGAYNLSRFHAGYEIPGIDLEADAVEKLETAQWTPEESCSDVVRRAHFPQKPHLARELLADFQQRSGRSPLSEEALDRLAETQEHPTRSTSRWD